MPAIEYSAVYLESILLNLLSNAALAPLRTAKIHFQSQIINDEIVLTVCDNGLELI
jgi:C4-dicarboxylate-specific signal transduction histidine kinase